ncbi:MAG: branched-chain amino acid ABC transporter permease [Solirubrobacterales bacterium]
MSDVLQQAVDALSVGSTYALLALGLTLVFSVMNLINFAYGMLLVWAAYAVIVLDDLGLPFLLIAPAVVVFVALLSMAIGRIAFRPFIGAPPITLLITSFGVLLVIQYLAILSFGEQPRVVPLPSFLNDVVEIGDIRVPVLELITIGTAGCVVLIYYGLINRTGFGAQIRAAAELPDIARLMGVKPDRVLAIVFAISGAIAGVVGLLWFAKVGAVTPRSDLGPTINAFIALVLGGLGSTRGALLGGLALGGIEVLMSATLPDSALGYSPAIVFAVVIAILILRPGGLSGTVLERLR